MNEETQVQVMERKELPEFMTSIDEARNRYNLLKRFVKSVMKEGSDYGIIPGTDKPTLLKPGAEKLNNIYGFYSEVEIMERTEDWDKPFFNYIVRATIYSKRTGIKESEGIGSCNSMESKYRYRWAFESDLPEELKDDKDSLKTKEIFSKKNNRKYKMFRIENEDIYSLVNTLQKMASKRAYIDATLKATRTSEMFTQDMEDIKDYEPKPKSENSDSGEADENEIKVLLKGINDLRETVGVNKEELAQIVKDKFNKTDPFKLTRKQIGELQDILNEKLSEKFDEFDEGK
jgi:hypothetical protein